MTIRFRSEELRIIQHYLRRNPAFGSISSLGRVATMEFIQTRRTLSLHPGSGSQGQGRPSFLWDYDVTEAQVHEVLEHAPFDQRKWLIGRILERLRPPEVFQYLTLEQIQEALPRLRLDEKTKRHWQEATSLWTQERSRS